MNISQIASNLADDLNEETDELLLLVLSAGVPFSQITMTTPKVVLEGNFVRLIGEIGFKQ